MASRRAAAMSGPMDCGFLRGSAGNRLHLYRAVRGVALTTRRRRALLDGPPLTGCAGKCTRAGGRSRLRTSTSPSSLRPLSRGVGQSCLRTVRRTWSLLSPPAGSISPSSGPNSRQSCQRETRHGFCFAHCRKKKKVLSPALSPFPHHLGCDRQIFAALASPRAPGGAAEEVVKPQQRRVVQLDASQCVSPCRRRAFVMMQTRKGGKLLTASACPAFCHRIQWSEDSSETFHAQRWATCKVALKGGESQRLAGARPRDDTCAAAFSKTIKALSLVHHPNVLCPEYHVRNADGDVVAAVFPVPPPTFEKAASTLTAAGVFRALMEVATAMDYLCARRLFPHLATDGVHVTSAGAVLVRFAPLQASGEQKAVLFSFGRLVEHVSPEHGGCRGAKQSRGRQAARRGRRLQVPDVCDLWRSAAVVCGGALPLLSRCRFFWAAGMCRAFVALDTVAHHLPSSGCGFRSLSSSATAAILGRRPGTTSVLSSCSARAALARCSSC